MAKRRHCNGRHCGERGDEAISPGNEAGRTQIARSAWRRLATTNRGNAVIYMVEMDMNLGDREAEWHAWYLAHIKVLLTVPGFRASQRFKAVLPCPAPYLALHQVDSGAIFDSAEYRACGGPAST